MCCARAQGTNSRAGVQGIPGAEQEPRPALPPYLRARSCRVPEASYQLHRVPKAQESETQKQRQGSQEGVVLVDLDRWTDSQTHPPSAFLPRQKTRIHFPSHLTPTGLRVLSCPPPPSLSTNTPVAF